MNRILKQKWLVRLRRRVEQEMRKILWDRYKLEVESDTPIRYYLDFKNDDRLLELKETLERIERGNFGTCSLCGEPIDLRLLSTTPATQFCATCMGGLQPSLTSAHERDAVPEFHRTQ